MENIKWGKLFDSLLLGILMSICIIAFILIIVACVRLLCLSFELAALIITFVLLVVGLTYWAYKYDIL